MNYHYEWTIIILINNNHYELIVIIFIDPFLPTGQFFATKFIILILYLIDFLFFKVLF